MDPINLFLQYFGRTVPFFMIALFTYYFWLKYNECGDVEVSLRYAARETRLW